MAPIDLDRLDREGWTAVPDFLPLDRAADLALRCRALLAGDDVRQGDKRAGGTLHAADLPNRLPEVPGLFEHPAVVAAVSRLLGRAAPLSDLAFRCPQPGFGKQSLHADDLPLTHATESRAVTSIVALCDFTVSNGATAVVPGSHRRPDLQRDARRLDLSGAEIVLTGPAGTAFVFSAHILHRATLNRSDAPRPALQAQWRLQPG